MGTRHVLGFVVGDDEKIGYGQFDGYPEGVGMDVYNWLKAVDLEQARQAAAELKVVSQDAPPTEEEKKLLKKYHDGHVSSGDPQEWYALLRRTQGDPALILESGYVEDSRSFTQDGLFCEWGWIVDFDRNRLEVYEGFHQEPHTEGRFAQRFNPSETHKYVLSKDAPDHPNPDVCWRCGAKVGTPEFEKVCPDAYYPIKLIASFPLDDLPDEETFLKTIKAASRYPDDE